MFNNVIIGDPPRSIANALTPTLVMSEKSDEFQIDVIWESPFEKINYLANALMHPYEFSKILEKIGFDDQELTVEEIYKKYSTGDRHGKWTILNFEPMKANEFMFSCEDISILSGYGNTWKFTFEEGEIVKQETLSSWMA